METKTFRIEKDTMGEVKVPLNAYYSAQSQRSIDNFKIGNEKMPKELIHAFALLKKSVALVNLDLKKLDETKAKAIAKACDEILEDKFSDAFPLSLWQTGSGTQTNMNLNEVIASRATEILGGDFRVKNLVHPNDDVNKSQSSNDTFPAAMHIASVLAIEGKLIPALNNLIISFEHKIKEFEGIIKIGRTHLQDATPLSLSQEFSGYLSMLTHSLEQIKLSLEPVRELALGGTAVGTGLNAHPLLGEKVALNLSELTKTKFITAPNKFHALTSHDALNFSHGAIKSLASNLFKIANDIRHLASGPRCGLGELNIPENEPGSSIMPGKVNPTQCEALTMCCVQVFANDVAISFSAASGNFELNVYKPVLIYNFLQSVQLLSDSMNSFNIHCVEGITANKEKIDFYLQNSLMLVTALNPHIGYENAAKVAKNAFNKNISLKESALELGVISAEKFDEVVDPALMIAPR